ncbi:hypothetical protein BGZ70_009310 [Mortierella alpina]|uniref:Prokaryotic-type class I peptide chain release factors domain-containing protein n=1 Tax=Mortierella alpina TaxID=64518 RepID=A0A9P6J1R1_MORAP|nr:hypothetical protein BGZ70_009310 [Mortierella alpina]
MISSRLCQQCLYTLTRRATITPKRALYPQGLAPVASFSTSHLSNAAFLRPGPGRELGIAFKKTAESKPKHLQGQRAQSLSASNKTVTPAPGASSTLSSSVPEAADHSTEPTSVHPSSSPLTTTTTTATDRPLKGHPTAQDTLHPTPAKPSYKEIILLETDFRERFIKGGGNGGQKINKTNSNVELKHLETGIVVQCQATRSLPQNRKLARRILIGRLDEYYNGEMSKRGQKAEKIRERKKRMARKSAKKYRAVGTDAASECNDDNDDEDGSDDDDDEDDDGYGGKDEGGDKEEALKKDSKSMPEVIIHSTTLEEILAGDNKKPSRRKSGRKE